MRRALLALVLLVLLAAPASAGGVFVATGVARQGTDLYRIEITREPGPDVEPLPPGIRSVNWTVVVSDPWTGEVVEQVEDLEGFDDHHHRLGLSDYTGISADGTLGLGGHQTGGAFAAEGVFGPYDVVVSTDGQGSG